MQIGSLRDILGWSGTIPQHRLTGVTRPISFRVLVVPDHGLGHCGAVQLAICRVPNTRNPVRGLLASLVHSLFAVLALATLLL